MTRVLLRTFAAGFYKVHAGLLVTLFVTVFINFFFTNVLNQTHLDKEHILLNNLKLVLTSVSNPVAMAVLFIIWLAYTVKSCQFVAAQFKLHQYQFLFYSSNALSYQKQFQLWFLVQTVISLPILVLGFFAVAVGIIFNYFVIPIIIPVYLLILISGSALYYVRLLNSLVEKKERFYVPDLIKTFPKPVFSLFLYQIIFKLKLSYGITKAIAVILIAGMYFLFRDHPEDIRIAGVSMLGVITAHTVLIYQSNEFERFYLSFCRNFPSARKQLYLQFAVHYLLLLLPEIILFFCLYNPLIAAGILLLGLAYALLLRTILYWQNHPMGKYLQNVFGLFILSSLAVMFGILFLLAAFYLVVSYVIFSRNYYRSQE